MSRLIGMPLTVATGLSPGAAAVGALVVGVPMRLQAATTISATNGYAFRSFISSLGKLREFKKVNSYRILHWSIRHFLRCQRFHRQRVQLALPERSEHG